MVGQFTGYFQQQSLSLKEILSVVTKLGGVKYEDDAKLRQQYQHQ